MLYVEEVLEKILNEAIFINFRLQILFNTKHHHITVHERLNIALHCTIISLFSSCYGNRNYLGRKKRLVQLTKRTNLFSGYVRVCALLLQGPSLFSFNENWAFINRPNDKSKEE